MKRKLTLFLAIILTACLALSSCEIFAPREYEITYNFGTDAENLTVTVSDGGLVPEPRTPQRDGYVFDGWFCDSEYKNQFDFSKPPTSDLTLYIRWREADESTEIDFEALVNELTLNKIRGAVTLSVEKYDLGGLFGASKVNVSRVTGSGVVYAEKDGYYYCLTNNHVVSKGTKSYLDITVIDYQSETYTAELLCADPQYDLAVIRILKNPTEPLEVIKFETERPAIAQGVIAIGAPSGQQNAITFGDVIKYDTIKIDGAYEEISNVSFEVLWHDAPMENGSSGGVLIDFNMNIIGINYAAATKDGEFVFGFAVTSDRVIEFLNANNLNFIDP